MSVVDDQHGADNMTIDDIANELARIEAEAGCELAEISDATMRKRARRLLDCDDPPNGDDLRLCHRIANEP